MPKKKKFKDMNMPIEEDEQNKVPKFISNNPGQFNVEEPNLIKQDTNIIKSSEEGFTGDPKKWFNNDLYYKDLPGKSDIYHEKDYYFNSYSSFYIHEEMIKDKVRTGTYQKAILDNKEVFKDKIVLDIGCGTGILSIFAVQAGAKHVYGIEFADIADFAKDILVKNKLEDKITIIKSKVEEAVLPVDKVDIIISEWMGYLLLYEAMLDTVLYARDKWLKKDGLMFPDRAMIFMAGLEDRYYKERKVDSWEDVYGFNMSVVKKSAVSEPLIDTCSKDYIITDTAKILDISLYTVKKEDLDFVSGYKLNVFKTDYFSCLTTWFDVVFERVPHPITLHTGPFGPYTHWKQVELYLEKNIKVNKGEVVKGNIAILKDQKNPRYLNIKVSYHFEGGKGDFVNMYILA